MRTTSFNEANKTDKTARIYTCIEYIDKILTEQKINREKVIYTTFFISHNLINNAEVLNTLEREKK